MASVIEKLIRAYHGSPYRFDEFDLGRAAERRGSYANYPGNKALGVSTTPDFSAANNYRLSRGRRPGERVKPTLYELDIPDKGWLREGKQVPSEYLDALLLSTADARKQQKIRGNSFSAYLLDKMKDKENLSGKDALEYLDAAFVNNRSKKLADRDVVRRILSDAGFKVYSRRMPMEPYNWQFSHQTLEGLPERFRKARKDYYTMDENIVLNPGDVRIIDRYAEGGYVGS